MHHNPLSHMMSFEVLAHLLISSELFIQSVWHDSHRLYTQIHDELDVTVVTIFCLAEKMIVGNAFHWPGCILT